MFARIVPIALLAVIGTIAFAANDVVTIESNYRLRKYPGFDGARIRVLRRPTVARVLETKGRWKKVCLAGAGKSCRGGEVGWVWGKAVHSGTPAKYEAAQTDAGACVKCTNNNEHGPKRDLEPIASAEDDNPTGYGLPGFAPACSVFITKRGLGHWGLLLTKTAELRAKDCFYEQNIFGDICPNYVALPKHQKKAILAMVFAAIGHHEASCDPAAINHKATNGQGDGMFMMEHSAGLRQQSHRNAKACQINDDNAATFSPVFQVACAVSIINDTICHGEDAPLIHRRRNNYFAQLKGEKKITRRIRATLKQWKLCR